MDAGVDARVAPLAAIVLAAGMMMEEEKERKKKRKWMKEWLKRSEKSSYNQIFQELRTEERQDFINYCRMAPEIFFLLLNKVSPLITKNDTTMRESIPAGARLEATLRWLANGGSYTSLQYSTRISKQSLSKIIPETCEAIYSVLKDEYLKTPSTNAEWKVVADDFQNKWNFPNCIGALDGKHIVLQPPGGSGSYYFNYKGTHSIILLGLVNANLEFIYADVGVNGRASDAAAWDVSNLRGALESGTLNVPEEATLPNSNRKLPFVIVGDDAFPLKKYLMKPFPFRNQNHEQRIFSYRLSRARRVVENAFGILANRFRVLLAPINLAPSKIQSIVMACLVLHNLLRRLSPEYTSADNLDVEQVENGVVITGNWRRQGALLNLQRQGGNSALDAKGVREEFTKYFSNEGSVPWQQRFIEEH